MQKSLKNAPGLRLVIEMSSILKDPIAEVRKALFGSSIRQVSIPVLHEKTGIPTSTLRSWRKDPRKMPFLQAVRIANAIGLSSEDWQGLRKK